PLGESRHTCCTVLTGTRSRPPVRPPGARRTGRPPNGRAVVDTEAAPDGRGPAHVPGAGSPGSQDRAAAQPHRRTARASQAHTNGCTGIRRNRRGQGGGPVNKVMEGPVKGIGGFFAMTLDSFRYTFSRPVQWREFI